MPRHPISLQQLDSFVKEPSYRRIVDACVFLHRELPNRLSEHIGHLMECKTECGDIQHEANNIVHQRRAALESFQAKAHDIGMASCPSGLRSFASLFSNLRSEIEGQNQLAMSVMQLLAEQPQHFKQPQRVRAMNRVLDLITWYTLGLRLMSHQFDTGLRLLEGSPPVSAVAGIGAPVPPPHLQPSGPTNLVSLACPLLPLLQLSTLDVKAFCVEKNSASPQVVVTGDSSLRATVVESYVDYVYVEVLKNAMQAVIAKHGAWDVDEAPPITVHVASPPRLPSHAVITVADRGGGVPLADRPHFQSWFYSSHAKRAGGYGYSRDHGSQFQGLGAGAALTRVYAHFMGGDVRWDYSPPGSTSVTFVLPKAGFVF